MKRRELVGALLLLGAPGIALAQARPTAAELVARVDAFHGRTRTIRARFSQFFWSRAYGRTSTSRGRIAIERPGRVRFDYDPPNGKIFVAEGARWLMYEPFDGGPGQFSRGTSSALIAALGILSGAISLDAYRASVADRSAGAPADTDALELVPVQRDPHHRCVRLHVDARGAVRRVGLLDHEGNWNTFALDELAFDAPIDPSTFSFTPPAGAREL
ncbi:LolA family protein [Sandaracinus amylolyticus]|nr:outer membrane lipoprotein carrier protein LolA [Sandaracinus amylolyticus]